MLTTYLHVPTMILVACPRVEALMPPALLLLFLLLLPRPCDARGLALWRARVLCGAVVEREPAALCTVAAVPPHPASPTHTVSVAAVPTHPASPTHTVSVAAMPTHPAPPTHIVFVHVAVPSR